MHTYSIVPTILTARVLSIVSGFLRATGSPVSVTVAVAVAVCPPPEGEALVVCCVVVAVAVWAGAVPCPCRPRGPRHSLGLWPAQAAVDDENAYAHDR